MNVKRIYKYKRGVYLLPSSITTIALFLAFYSIINSINNNFDIAAIAIFFAMIFDFIDGKIARLTKTQSYFGAQYDSMADLVSFGVAPSLLLYNSSFHNLGLPAIMCIFVYLACTCLRLSRFNAQLNIVQNESYFQGLPSPAAGVFIAYLVYLDIAFLTNEVVFIPLILICSILMVSNIKYDKLRNINLKKKTSVFKVFIIITIICLSVSLAMTFLVYNVILFIFILISFYIFFYPVLAMVKISKIKSIYKKKKKNL